jgi:uncharacterized small protein (DUF1192 family)
MKRAEGWGGKSPKEHVESAQIGANNAENDIAELAIKVEELEGRISDIETEQAQRKAETNHGKAGAS